VIELERRRPGWIEGAWVELGDGQKWSVPKPTASEPDTFMRLLEDLMKLDDDQQVEQLSSVANLAGILIRRNYSLTDGELSALLTLGQFAGKGGGWTPRSIALWPELAAIIKGQLSEDGRTLERWYRLASIRTGTFRGVVLLEDLNGLIDIEVADKRFPASGQWVDWIAERIASQRMNDELNSLM
jgi:hypothetical protein